MSIQEEFLLMHASWQKKKEKKWKNLFAKM
jgi:hypothetical protein